MKIQIWPNHSSFQNCYRNTHHVRLLKLEHVVFDQKKKWYEVALFVFIFIEISFDDFN